MKCILRPYRNLGFGMMLIAGLAMTPREARAQANDLGQLMEDSGQMLLSSSQGYLGVDLADVDTDKAQSLKL